MVVFQKVCKLKVSPLHLKDLFLVGTFVLNLHGQTSSFPVCLHWTFLLSLLNHAVKIQDNIKRMKISNATHSVITHILSILLLLIYYFNIAMSLPENVPRDTFVLPKNAVWTAGDSLDRNIAFASHDSPLCNTELRGCFSKVPSYHLEYPLQKVKIIYQFGPNAPKCRHCSENGKASFWPCRMQGSQKGMQFRAASCSVSER